MAADPASYPRLGKARQGKMKSTCSRGSGEIPRLQCVPCAHAIHEPAKWVDKNFKRETAAEGAAEAVALAVSESGRAGQGRRGVPGELNWSAALCGRRDKATQRNWVDRSPPTYTHTAETDSASVQRLKGRL